MFESTNLGYPPLPPVEFGEDDEVLLLLLGLVAPPAETLVLSAVSHCSHFWI